MDVSQNATLEIWRMNKIVNIADVPNPKTGKTPREENAAKSHTIPIGTLVEVKIDYWHGDGACEKIHARLWVVKHTRDCDQTPMYSISRMKDPMIANMLDRSHHGIIAEHMKVIEVTESIKAGEGALEWDDDGDRE